MNDRKRMRFAKRKLASESIVYHNILYTILKRLRARNSKISNAAGEFAFLSMHEIMFKTVF